MPNPIEILGGFLMPSEEEKGKISRSKKKEVGLEASPETKEREPVEVERERRKTLEREVREMTLTPELEERAAEDKKEIAGLDKEGEENRFRNLIEKDGYLYAIKVVMDSGNANALDRLHSFLNNPKNAHLLEKK